MKVRSLCPFSRRPSSLYNADETSTALGNETYIYCIQESVEDGTASESWEWKIAMEPSPTSRKHSNFRNTDWIQALRDTFASFVGCLDIFRMFRGSPEVYLALTSTTEDPGRLGVLVLPSAEVLDEKLYPRFSARVVCKKLGLFWLTLLAYGRVFILRILNNPELVPNSV